MPKNVGDLDKLIVAKGFKKVAQSPIYRSIWSHWPTAYSNSELNQGIYD